MEERGPGLDEFRGEMKVKGYRPRGRRPWTDTSIGPMVFERGLTDYFSKILPTAEHRRLYERFKGTRPTLISRRTGARRMRTSPS